MKIGIAGVGRLGKFHCNVLSRLPTVDLTGVYDIDQNRNKNVAKTFHCQAFKNYAELLNSVDAVGIVVPTTDHLNMVKKAFEMDKPVFVEKPIAASIEQAREMVQLAHQKNLILQVGHIERFNPAIRALDPIKITPRFIESHRLAPFDPRGTDVAVVLDLMIHDIDIILSLVDSPVEKIDSNGVSVVSEEIDIANSRIRFENGCVANVTASRISQKKMRKMRLFQKDSYISIDFLQRISEVFQLSDTHSNLDNTIVLGQIDKGTQKHQIIYNRLDIPEGDAMQTEWENFIDSIQTNKKPIVSGEDALNALIIASKITQEIHDQNQR